MNTFRILFVIVQIIALSLTISCSNTDESNEKDVIRKTTDKIAHKVTDTINNPIDKAKYVEELGNIRTRKIEDSAKQN